MNLQNVERIILEDGHSYKGWGYYKNNVFVPHGCGKKFFDGYYTYGNFINGLLDGPAIVSHDYFMTTMQFKNNCGNGWGLHINEGVITEFGYYENNQLKNDLIDFVEWYFQVLENSGRASFQNMLSMYTFTESKGVSDLLIGYSGGKRKSTGLKVPYMGFHFKPDGSVWVGTTFTQEFSGILLHFRPDGLIDSGEFDKGNLVERMSLKDIINYYSYEAFANGQSELNFPDIEEIKINYNYFTDSYISTDNKNNNNMLDEDQLNLLNKLAEEGDVEAQYKLGNYYLDDDNDNQDEHKAYEYFYKSANKGYLESMFMLGLAHVNDWADEPSKEEAYRWFSKAADLGHANAICWVGHCLLNGIGTDVSEEKGLEYIKRAVDLNNTNALIYYGDLLMEHTFKIPGLEHNYEKGVEYVKKAAMLGDSDAQYHLGCIYTVNPKYSTAEGIDWMRKAAEQGNDDAQLELGNHYYDGRGVPRSYIEAIEWYKKSAEQNNETAQFCMGRCYYEGKGVEKSYSEALVWYKKANENGDGIWSKIYMGICYYYLKQYDKALEIFKETIDDWGGESLYYIGLCYLDGNGVDKSLETAFNNFLKSAEKKNVKAQYQVGMMYKDGEGVIKDAEQAFHWFKLSAESNNADAQYQLARCYSTGVGTEKNKHEALVWMQKAAENGNVYADWEYSMMSDPDGFERAIDNF